MEGEKLILKDDASCIIFIYSCIFWQYISSEGILVHCQQKRRAAWTS